MSKAHAPYIKLITQAIAGLKNPFHGSSRAAIRKFIEQNDKIAVNAAAFRSAFTKGVKEGLLVHSETGDKFKLSPKAREGAKRKKTKTAATTTTTTAASKKKTTKKETAAPAPAEEKKAEKKTKTKTKTASKKKAPTAGAKPKPKSPTKKKMPAAKKGGKTKKAPAKPAASS